MAIAGEYGIVASILTDAGRAGHAELLHLQKLMEIEFDATKDAANIDKHGISLSRAAELEILAYVVDMRFDEPRFRLYGLIDGEAHCVAGTDRDGIVRIISLRRAHAKEMKRYVP